MPKLPKFISPKQTFFLNCRPRYSTAYSTSLLGVAHISKWASVRLKLRMSLTRPVPPAAFPFLVGGNSTVLAAWPNSCSHSCPLSTHGTTHTSNTSLGPAGSTLKIYPESVSYYLSCYHIGANYHLLLPGLLQNPLNWSLYFQPWLPTIDSQYSSNSDHTKCMLDCLCSKASSGCQSKSS